MLRRPLLRLPRTRGLASSTSELLHSSRIPTLHFQDSLPKLPVPTLKATLGRLLTSAEPLVSAAELAETHRLVADFEYGGAGERLQAQLIAKDQLRYSSFISEPWFDMYLTDIDPTSAPAPVPAPASASAPAPASGLASPSSSSSSGAAAAGAMRSCLWVAS